jgi:hypothetical protein
MRKACPGIDQVWLLDHRSDPPQWDLLAFADRRSLETLRERSLGRRPDVQLLVVVDGERFEPAWGDHAAGRLDDIDWRIEDAETATFRSLGGSGREATRMTAVRVR